LLELDHVFCIVSEPAQTARWLEHHGWMLDDGQIHRGQGTRNRRLNWTEQFLELIGVIDAAEATCQPAPPGPSLRLGRDRRQPARSVIFLLEIGAEEIKQRRIRRAASGALAPRQPAELGEIRVHGPSGPSLPSFAGPPITYVPGPHLLELVVGDETVPSR
jgi:hypothetical protein